MSDAAAVRCGSGDALAALWAKRLECPRDVFAQLFLGDANNADVAAILCAMDWGDEFAPIGVSRADGCDTPLGGQTVPLTDRCRVSHDLTGTRREGSADFTFGDRRSNYFR